MCRNVFGFGAVWQWAGACNSVALYLVFRQSYRALKRVFLVFLAVLSVSFLGCALWVGFNAGEVARGLVRVEMPGRQGASRSAGQSRPAGAPARSGRQDELYLDRIVCQQPVEGACWGRNRRFI